MSNPRPPFDPELSAVLAVVAEMLPSTLTPDMIQTARSAATSPPVADIMAAWPGIGHREEIFAGHDGGDVVLSIFARVDQTHPGPGFYFIHGGGMVAGDRLTGIDTVLDWVERFSGVCVSVEYRLAPEFPDPVPVEDCYAGLKWTVDNLAVLGIDPTRVMVVGASAGGGLAAGTALLARDRQGPALLGQVLMYPMLDDRNNTVSSLQVDGVGVWDHTSNETGWNALLGPRRGTDDVSIYASPARATDLAALPPAYLDVGTVEVFRDEVVAYASGIWTSGGVAELHVWPGGFHSFDLMAPHAALSRAMVAARTAWVQRMLEP